MPSTIKIIFAIIYTATELAEEQCGALDDVILLCAD